MSEAWGYICLSSICWLPLVMLALGIYIGRNGLPFQVAFKWRGQADAAPDYEVEA